MIARNSKKLYTFILDLIFPVYCLGCNTEGQWICPLCLPRLQDNHHHHELLRTAIHACKYEGARDLVQPLGVLLREKAKHLCYDYIIPVPLHKRRYRERGFNQSQLLAREIDPDKVLTRVLVKTRATTSQMKLTRTDRLTNLIGAFLITDKSTIKNKTILLIDDITTTGATLKECKKVLLQSGAKQVIHLTLC